MTPIALFVYGRPEHTAKTLNALVQNKRADETRLVVFCDGARQPQDQGKVQKTRDCVKDILSNASPFGSVEIIERTENWGLARSIIEGVSSVIDQSQRTIVIEDDLVTSPLFLSYHLNALEHYKDRQEVFMINGYSPPLETQTIPADYTLDTYFTLRNSSWGWSTWQDRWAKIDFAVKDYDELKNSLSLQLAFNRLGDDVSQMLYCQQEQGLSSWAIRASYSQFRNHGLSLSPRHSFVDNIGLDSSGENSVETNHMRNDLSRAVEITDFPDQLYIDERIMNSFRAIHARVHPGLFGKAADDYWQNKRTKAGTSLLLTAETLLQTGDIRGAKEALDKHLSYVPGDPAANTLMGYLALQLGKGSSAEDCFRFALLTYADYAPAIHGMKQLLAQTPDQP